MESKTEDMLIIEATANLSDSISFGKMHKTNDEYDNNDKSHHKNINCDNSENILSGNSISGSENNVKEVSKGRNDDVSEVQKLNKASLLVLLDSFITSRPNYGTAHNGIEKSNELEVPEENAESREENFDMMEPSQYFTNACSFMGIFITDNEVKYLERLTGAIIRNATSNNELERSAMCEGRKFEMFLNSTSSNDYFASITMANHIKSNSSSSKKMEINSNSASCGVDTPIGVRKEVVKVREQSHERKADEKGSEKKRGDEIEKEGGEEREEGVKDVQRLLSLPTAAKGIHVLEFFSGIG